MIKNYEFGSIKIDGKNYDHDLILFKDKITDWWRKEGHNVDISDLKELPEHFDVLVIGSGASGCCKVPEETIKYVEEKGAKVIVAMTADAVKIYNKLFSEKKEVAGAFHLTC